MGLIASPPPVEDLEQGVIEEARRRQRARRVGFAGVALTAALVGIIGFFGSGGGTGKVQPQHRSGSQAGSSSPKAPANLFTQEPDMGVACRVPNSIACDRIGLAVWLRRPAIAVNATIAGSRLNLNDPAWSGPLRNGRRSMFAGFLQPAGLLNGSLKVRPDHGRYHWIGSHPLFANVRIVADYGDGHTSSVSVRVQVRAGWG
jgi:hypothetical protein